MEHAERYGGAHQPSNAWTLATAGDVAALRRAARETSDEYARHRAEAFALALEGAPDAALAEMAAGWRSDWPFPVAYALDVARIRLLAGEPEGALTALSLGLRGHERLTREMRELLVACVSERPWLWRYALSVVADAGRVREQAAAAAAVIRARFGSAERTA